MLIYLEGPDGSGKTTLAKELCAKGNAYYLHDTYRGRHQFIYTIALLRRVWKLHKLGKNVVLDRSWLGDNIYSRVFRPGKQGDWVRWAHGITERLGAITVMALPAERERYLADYNALKGERPEMYDRMQGIYQAYAEVTFGLHTDADDYAGMLSRQGGLQASRATVIYDRYGPAGNNLGDFANQLWERARQRHLSSIDEVPGLSDNWSGRQNKDTVLLVGERSARPYGAWTVPFLADDNSSRYLAQALTAADVRQDRLCMVNARNEVDQPDWSLRTALQRKPRKIICLGQVALRTVRELDPVTNSVVALEHPQYRRRFKFHDLHEYALKLKEACL